MLITQVNQSHRSIAIRLQLDPSISWRFSHDEKRSLDLHRYVISLTFKIFCVAISEPKMCFSFIISDPDYEKVCYSWTIAFIGEVFHLFGNRALDGSKIHVKDPSTIWVDNVTNHTFTTKLYPPRSDCNIRIDLLSNR